MVDVEACCCAPIEALCAKSLVVPVEAPKLELCCRFEALDLLAPKLALLVRFAEALRAPVELEDELPWLALFELPFAANAVPVVPVAAWLFPVVLALPPPLLEGLLKAVLLVVLEVSFPFPLEAETAPAAAVLEDPWLAWLWVELAARVPEAARSSVALTAPLDWRADEDCSCPPTDALCAKLSVVAVEAPKLELSCAPCAKLSDEDSLALWL